MEKNNNENDMEDRRCLTCVFWLDFTCRNQDSWRSFGHASPDCICEEWEGNE